MQFSLFARYYKCLRISMKKTALRKSKPYLYGCKLIRGTPLGANISGSGVIVSTKSCQEQGKIIDEYTQVALINDSGLVLALTDKLDVDNDII
jgi:hypothetical protein